MWKDFTEFVSAVFNRWVEWVGIVLSIIPFLEKLPAVRKRLKNRPILERSVSLLWVIGLACVVLGFFSAWREEHAKVKAQGAYIEFRADEIWVQVSPPWGADRQGGFNFGYENTTSYPALEMGVAREIVSRKLPVPLGSLMALNTSPSTPQMEESVWKEMLSDEKNARHVIGTFDPGEKRWTTAFTKELLTDGGVQRYIGAVDIFYVVALAKWRDGSGVHAKTLCYWLHPPMPGVGPRIF